MLGQCHFNCDRNQFLGSQANTFLLLKILGFLQVFPINCWSLIPAIRGWSRGCMLGQFVYSLWGPGGVMQTLQGRPGISYTSYTTPNSLPRWKFLSNFLVFPWKFFSTWLGKSITIPEQILIVIVAVIEKCLWKMFSKSVFEKCLWKVSLKNVFNKYLWKVFLKSVCERCLWKVSLKSAFERCLWKVSLKMVFKNVFLKIIFEKCL